MSLPFSISRYSGTAATGVWTLGWVVTACCAGEHLATSRKEGASLNVVVTIACAIFGAWLTFRTIRRPRNIDVEQTSREPWSHRAAGWLVTIVWCCVAVVWNLAIVGSQIGAADQGQTLTLLLMIPFSLIGLLLLIVLFISGAVALDSLFQTARRSRPDVTKRTIEPIESPPIVASDTDKPNDLVSKVFQNPLFQISWVIFLAVIFTTVAWPIRNAALVCWVYGMDAYFERGVRILSGKPVRFSTGELAPTTPDIITGFGAFFITTLGLSMLLTLVLRLYERISRKRK